MPSSVLLILWDVYVKMEDVAEKLKKYAESSTTTPLKFPPSLTGAERAEIHAISQQLHLRAVSEGSKEHGKRFITVRKLTDKEVKELKKKQDAKKKAREAPAHAEAEAAAPDPWSQGGDAAWASDAVEEAWLDWAAFAEEEDVDLYKALGVTPNPTACPPPSLLPSPTPSLLPR